MNIKKPFEESLLTQLDLLFKVGVDISQFVAFVNMDNLEFPFNSYLSDYGTITLKNSPTLRYDECVVVPANYSPTLICPVCKRAI